MSCLRCKATPWGIYGPEKGIKIMLEHLKSLEKEKQKK